jgi:peptidoglycan/LPS O-acetylase OafA/YrhL
MVKLGEWSFTLYLVDELVLRTALELGPETLPSGTCSPSSE